MSASINTNTNYSNGTPKLPLVESNFGGDASNPSRWADTQSPGEELKQGYPLKAAGGAHVAGDDLIGDFDPADLKNYPEISQKTKDALAKNNIVSLFPIQHESFYPIFGGADIVGRDLTGSGKTLAYTLPLVEYLRKEGLMNGRTRSI